jgi:hypothetical protein
METVMDCLECAYRGTRFFDDEEMNWWIECRKNGFAVREASDQICSSFRSIMEVKEW